MLRSEQRPFAKIRPNAESSPKRYLALLITDKFVVLNLPKTGSIEKPDRPFMSYFSEEQIREIQESERLLFRIFKNFGITY